MSEPVGTPKHQAGTATTRTRALNDALRRTGCGGRTVVTAGVAALPSRTRAALLAAVRVFDHFDADNDPHGEHDFGAVAVESGGVGGDGAVRCFWKIDCYDRALTGASPDPADPAVTARVLTLMLAEEY